MDTFLRVMRTEGDSTWFILLTIENQEMSFKLDTGAEVTAISEGAFNKTRQCYPTGTFQDTIWTYPQNSESTWTV